METQNRKPRAPLALGLVLVSSLVALGGCVGAPGQNVFRDGEMGRAARVEYGTITATRSVTVKGEPGIFGGLLGGTAGGFGASVIGTGAGQVAAVASGAVGGIALGILAEEALRTRDGTEYTVALEKGGEAVIAQETNDGDRPLRAGDRVALRMGDGYQRLMPAAAAAAPAPLLP